MLVAVLVGGYFISIEKKQDRAADISTFEECAATGYPIMESYPEQCRTPDGRTFVREIPDPITPPIIPPVACTMDAMQCPDGSYVGRTGSKCEFVCPPYTSESGVRGTVMLGPTCPVMQNPPDPECADRPFKTDLVLTSTDGTKILKYFNSDSQGVFSVSIAPGFYLIRSAPGGPSMPSCAKSEVIEVKTNSYTITTVSCDTGIR